MAPQAHALFRDASPAALFTACFSILSIAEVGGNVTALIAFNYWMRAFEYGSATVTVNFLCAFFYVLMFVPMAVTSACRYVATSRHGRAAALRRLRRVFLHPRQLGNAFLIALSDCWIDIASTYAAGRTTVLTQVFAKSTEPLITFALTRLVLRETRKRAPTTFTRALPFAGFFFVAAGVVCHMYERLEERKHNEAATAFYIALYLTGVVGSSCYAITQARFIRGATAAFEALPLNEQEEGGEPNEEEHGEDPEIPRQLIRSMALAMDTTMTLVITLLVVPPLDTIPHFGHSKSYADVWTNLHDGVRCVAECPGNLGYAVLTTGGWASVYLADTFMNHFSPTLNSMVNEFTAPVGVIAMFVHPAWALSGPPSDTPKSIALDVASVVALVIGVASFARYELACSRRIAVLVPTKAVWERDLMQHGGGVPEEAVAGSDDDDDATRGHGGNENDDPHEHRLLVN